MKNLRRKLTWVRGFAALVAMMLVAGPGNRAVFAAPGASTNAPVKWYPLAEVLQKWTNTPLEEITRAAEAGNLTAMHYLGYCKHQGLRGAQDGQAAIAWYQRAGDAGYPPSYHNIGVMYECGCVTAVPRNLDEAVRYYRRAAELGFTNSQIHLGELYLAGTDVPKDCAEGIKWLTKAADGGSAQACWMLAKVEDCDGFDEVRSLEYCRRAADLGDTIAMYALAARYAADVGEPRNEQDRPINLLLRAAANGQNGVFRGLSYRYQVGLGTERDLVEAAGWEYRDSYSEWSRYGHEYTLIPRAFSYTTPPDPFSEIIVLYGHAATGADPRAFKKMGDLYLEGRNVPKNPERAKFWFALAASSGQAAPESPPEWLEQWKQASQAARVMVKVFNH